MKRKVIKQASGAYTITLPIDWVRKNRITKDSEIDLMVNEKSIIITNKGETEHKKIFHDYKDIKPATIGRIIKADYAKGIDEIEIVIESEKDISGEIIKTLGNTIGYALVSNDKNQYVIKDIGGTNYKDLDEIFKRVFQMILSFYESAINDVFGPESETVENLKARDTEINKFCYFLERAINKMSYEDQIIGRSLFTYAYELEKIGDEIERLWRANIKYKPKKSDRLEKLARLSKEGLDKAFELYFQFNPKHAEEVYSFREKVRDESMDLAVKTKDRYEIRLIRHIVKIVEEANDLTQLTFMMRL